MSVEIKVSSALAKNKEDSRRHEEDLEHLQHLVLTSRQLVDLEQGAARGVVAVKVGIVA